MSKCKFLLFIAIFATVFALGLQACGVNATSALPENADSSAPVLQPSSPSVETPDTENNSGDSQSVTASEDDKTDENATPTEDGDGQISETPTGEETPAETGTPSEPTGEETPAETGTPSKPTGEETPAETEVPEQPTVTVEPETPSATALKEGTLETVSEDGSKFSFTAEDEAYYAVKVTEESGGLIIGGEKAVSGANGGFCLYEVFLSEGKTLEYTVELAGGETGVYKADMISSVSGDACSAVSTENQKYFVFCAESDGKYAITLMLSESSEECSLGAYYLNGACETETEELEISVTCCLSKGQTAVIWTEQKDIEISVLLKQ